MEIGNKTSLDSDVGFMRWKKIAFGSKEFEHLNFFAENARTLFCYKSWKVKEDCMLGN